MKHCITVSCSTRYIPIYTHLIISLQEVTTKEESIQQHYYSHNFSSLRMQTLVYLYSDDIATIQPYENVEDQEEEPITVEEYDESIDLGHGNDDKDYDGSCDSELITSCNDGDDLDNSTHSLSEIEDDSSSSSQDDDNDKNEIHQSAGTRKDFTKL